MRSAAALAAIVLSIAVQTTLARYIFRDSSTAIDLVLIVVVYIAIKSGPVTGLLAGTVAGLVQDALSSGILGIGGLAKTIVGFLSGLLGTQFIVTAPLPRFLLLVLATALHAAISWLGSSVFEEHSMRIRSKPCSIAMRALSMHGSQAFGRSSSARRDIENAL